MLHDEVQGSTSRVTGNSRGDLVFGPAALTQRLLAIEVAQIILADPEPHMDYLLERGREFSTKGLHRQKLEPRRCHGNTARLWYESGGRIRIATGYAYSSGLWVQHSWGAESGHVVETTHRFEKYFGIELSARDALKFLLCNPFSDLLERVSCDIRSGVSPVK